MRINCQLNSPVILAETFKGDMSSKLVTGSDGKEERVGIEENTVYLMQRQRLLCSVQSCRMIQSDQES